MKLRDLIRAVGLLLVGWAIGRELLKPAAERTWHGRLAGHIPYDFRRPTLDRIRAAYWNPEEPGVFTDRVFGVGWGVNLYWVWRRLLDSRARLGL